MCEVASVITVLRPCETDEKQPGHAGASTPYSAGGGIAIEVIQLPIGSILLFKNVSLFLKTG